MRLRAILSLLFFSFPSCAFCVTDNVTPAQLQRSQEILQEENILRERIEKGEKVYIKQIEVNGVTLIESEKIQEITFGFNKHWLYQEDIEMLIESIKEIYHERGYSEALKDVSYLVKDNQLKIEVKERQPVSEQPRE